MSSPSSHEPTMHGQHGHQQTRRAVFLDTKEYLGKYRLVRLLAEGGFASVYLGEHLHLKTLAAIKVLRTQVEHADWEQFRAEARLVAHLRHAHIIRVHDFDLEEQVPYLVMDYAPSGNLRQRHPRGTRLSPETVLHYLKPLASALHYAHQQRLIHRDIKPENMLIGENDTLLLSDFGIAVALSTQTQAHGEVIGTLAYMAPEQWQGQPVQASDQYALAVVAYEWLAGHPPFQGGPAELAAQHVHHLPPSLHALVGLAPTLETVLLRALAKTPEERFADIQAFVLAFEAALQPGGLHLPFPPHEGAVVRESPDTDLYQAPTIQATLSASPPLPLEAQSVSVPHARMSRRVLLAGVTGMLAAGIGGSLSWFLTHRPGQSKPPLLSPTPEPVSPTPAQAPIGTTFHTYRGHHDGVYGLAASSDGSLLVSVSADTTVQVWDTSTGGVNAVTYTGHTGPVNAVAWSADSQWIVSGSDDNTARVWKTSDGSNPNTYTGHAGAVKAVAWSVDNQTVASGSADNTVQVWSAATGNLTFTYSGHTDQVNTVAWSPASGVARIASGSSDGTVQIWNASNGGNEFTYTGHAGAVNALAWSPDGSLIASGGDDKTVRIWKAATGELVSIYGGHGDVVLTLAWSPDGSLIASGGADSNVQVWEASTGSHTYTYKGHSAPVHAVTWLLPTQTTLASGSTDTTVQIWQAT